MMEGRQEGSKSWMEGKRREGGRKEERREEGKSVEVNDKGRKKESVMDRRERELDGGKEEV